MATVIFSDVKESDEVKEMYCEDCKIDLETIIKVDGFCTKCLKFMCSTCVRYHKKHFPEHILQDSTNMPKDFCFNKCPKHPKEILMFYCNNCEIEVCSKCKAKKHCGIECKEIFHIPTCASSDQMTNDIKEVTQSMEIAFEELAIRKDITKGNLMKVKTNNHNANFAIEEHKNLLINKVHEEYTICLMNQERKHSEQIDAYEKRRAEIIARLNKEKEELIKQHQREEKLLKESLQKNKAKILQSTDKQAADLKKESDRMTETCVCNLDLALSDIDKAEARVNDMKKAIEKNKDSGEKCKHFVTVKKVKSEMKRYMLEKKNFNEDNEIPIYQFMKNDTTINITRNYVSFGYLKNKSHLCAIFLSFKHENVIQEEQGSKTNSIGYRMCTINNYLVIVKEENSNIKLIDLENKKVKCSMTLPDKPFDVTKVEKEKVATTLTSAKRIQILSITKCGNLTLADSIYVGKECYGIDYMKPYLIVACQHPGSVEILHPNGVCIKSLQDFINPLNVVVGQNNCSFYITDKYDPKTETVKKSNYSLEIKRVSEKFYCWPNSQSCLFVDSIGFVFMLQSRANIGYYREGGRLFTLSQNLEKKDTSNSDTLTTGDIDTLTTGDIVAAFFCKEYNRLYVGNTKGRINVLKPKYFQ